MAGLIFVRQHLYSPKHARATRSDFTLRGSSGACVLVSVNPLGGGSSHKQSQKLTHPPHATGIYCSREDRGEAQEGWELDAPATAKARSPVCDSSQR